MQRSFLYRLLALFLMSAVTVSAQTSFAAPPAKSSEPKRLSTSEQKTLPTEFQLLIPLHKLLGEPAPNDWLAQHEERGETYKQYLAARPIRATAKRRTIWIQPLGEFT